MSEQGCKELGWKELSDLLHVLIFTFKCGSQEISKITEPAYANE